MSQNGNISGKNGHQEYYPFIVVSQNLFHKLHNKISLSDYSEPEKPARGKANALGCLIIPGLIILTLFLFGVMQVQIAKIITITSLSLVFLFWIKRMYDANDEYYERLLLYKKEYKKYRSQKVKSELLDSVTVRNNILKDIRLQKMEALISRFGKNTVRDRMMDTLKYRFQEKYLKKYFGHDSISVSEDDFVIKAARFAPDFILTTPQGLKIVIEIDQPYEEITRYPMHYADDDQRSDFLRDSYLSNDKDMIVLRFAEEQIAMNPNECCRFIAETALQICKEEITDKSIYHFLSPRKIRKWTFNECRLMAKENYRHQYMNNIPFDNHIIKTQRAFQFPVLVKEKLPEEETAFSR